MILMSNHYLCPSHILNDNTHNLLICYNQYIFDNKLL